MNCGLVPQYAGLVPAVRVDRSRTVCHESRIGAAKCRIGTGCMCGLEPTEVAGLVPAGDMVQLANAVADMDEPKSAGRGFSRVVGMYGLGGCGQPTAVLRTLTEQL